MPQLPPWSDRTKSCLVVGLLSLGCSISSGCMAPLMSSGGDAALKFKEPDAAFMKKVEKDPFPRAGASPPVSR